MPGMNRRGPKGEGAMSGRGRGRCNPSNREPNNFDAPAGAGRRATFLQEVGRGMGQGQGQGERMRRRDGSCRRRMG
ncbi:MAG: DUF5320 domain-containing protein [Proteiniphilum sp.]|nr:DUF5320 domain-containing protein [Proteiniphilum sp.]MDD3909233.1 DUF5320 domain-containing protein [Proteiniphilum sp.]